MTKTLPISIAMCLLCITLGFVLVGCGETPPASPTEYKITLPASTLYDIDANKTTAEAGEKITLNIDLNSAAYTITEVKANDIVCELEDGRYTFTMPESDVAVTVYTAIQEINSADVLSWSASAPSQISTAREGDNFAKQTIYFDFSENVNNPQAEIISTNEAVLPSSAIDIHFIDANMGTMKNGGYFNIDLTKVTVGETYLILRVHSSSGSNVDDTITKKIEVKEYGTLEVATWTNTLNFDLSRIFDEYSTQGEGITIQINDKNEIYGGPDYYVSQVATSEDETVTIKYVPNHAYTISIMVFEYTDDQGHIRIIAEFDLDEAFSGDSITGFNRYEDGELYFIRDGASLDIDVHERTYS